MVKTRSIALMESLIQASASEAGGRDLERNQASPSQGSEILRRKEEMLEALSARKVSAAGAGKTKRLKVVKHLVPQDLIDYMIETPSPLLDEVPEHELAKPPKFFRDAYARCKVKNDKIKTYHRALIDQYNAHGYAEDESEITDDEEEMEN